MLTVSLFEAKTHLSRIVEDLLGGKEDQVIVTRHGRPAVRLVPLRKADTSKRIGLARGRFEVPESIDGANAAVGRLLRGRGARA